MKVVKFGGTSVASAEQIKKVYDIVISDSKRKIVVVSAPGKRFENDTKVTDLLINYATNLLEKGKAETELNKILLRFEDICNNLQLSKETTRLLIEDLKDEINNCNKDNDEFLDIIKACGENYCAKIVSKFFQSKGLSARYVSPRDGGLYLSSESGFTKILEESYSNLKELKDEEDIIVFPGFFGYSLEGDIVTFPRGGSDITGSIIAAAVNADMYENFTDVDSVFVVNPFFVSDPLSISELTYSEMRELSYAGFTVFNEEALMPAFQSKIPVNIKNTNNPSAPGTKIVLKREKRDKPVVGIASDSGFCSIYVSKYLMNREIGFGRKLLKILEDEGLSYEHTPSGIDNISVILRDKQLNKEIEERIKHRIVSELEVDDISFERDLALIMIVGEGMRSSVGLVARATKAFAEAKINIEMINQGCSEVSMMFGIKQKDEKNAIQSLYKEFFI